MGKIVPRILRQRMSDALRWPLKYSDLEACFRGRVDAELWLDVHFADNNHDFIASARRGSSAKPPASGLNLLTVDYDPEEELWPPSWWRDLPPDAGVIHAGVWAIPQAAAFAQQVHRRLLREALGHELDQIGVKLLENRWVLQFWACPGPDRLEAVRTFWTGPRRETPRQRAIALPESQAAGD